MWSTQYYLTNFNKKKKICGPPDRYVSPKWPARSFGLATPGLYSVYYVMSTRVVASTKAVLRGEKCKVIVLIRPHRSDQQRVQYYYYSVQLSFICLLYSVIVFNT